MASAFFISDLHLGTRYGAADKGREALFEAWIRGLTGRATHLFLLGDIFEFWMEYRHYVPKHHMGVLSALYELRRSGVEIHYVCGNHDFNLGSFFEKSLGIITHNGPFEMNLQGKRLLLLHGDGLNPKDWKYRLVRKVLHHPLSNWAWKLLHPDLGMRIALGVGKASRDQETPQSYIGNDPARLAEYEEEARALLRRGYDIVVHGHIHVGFVKQVPEGIYVNTGEWLTRLEYLEMTAGVCELKTYQVAEGG